LASTRADTVRQTLCRHSITGNDCSAAVRNWRLASINHGKTGIGLRRAVPYLWPRMETTWWLKKTLIAPRTTILCILF